MFWPFPVWINCFSDLKIFANSRPSASNFKSFSQSLEHFFLTVGQNNFGNKIPIISICSSYGMDSKAELEIARSECVQWHLRTCSISWIMSIEQQRLSTPSWEVFLDDVNAHRGQVYIGQCESIYGYRVTSYLNIFAYYMHWNFPFSLLKYSLVPNLRESLMN